MTVKLGKVVQVDVRTAWPNEAAHFTPWLASPDGLELLQDALGMDLEVEATEQFIGPFRADILAKRTDTPDEHWVLIENQLEKTDHRHLGQLLTYAAGLKAATIVWVAQDFAEEHRAALDWLNDITSEDYQFFGLQIELWQIGNSEPGPMFNVVAEPNEWTREVQHSAESAPSDLKQQQLRYWQALRSKLAERASPVRIPSAKPRHYVNVRVGRSGTWISAIAQSQRKAISVEFLFRGPPGKVWFDELLAHRQAIEERVGAPLDWQRMEGKKRSRVSLQRDDLDPTDESQWSMQHDWLMETLEKFREVFGPYARAFSDDRTSSVGDDDEDEGSDEV